MDIPDLVVGKVQAYVVAGDEDTRRQLLYIQEVELIRLCCGSGSGIRCLFDPWIRDTGWEKSQDLDPGYGSGMNNPDHISESLETIFLG